MKIFWLENIQFTELLLAAMDPGQGLYIFIQSKNVQTVCSYKLADTVLVIILPIMMAMPAIPNPS